MLSVYMSELVCVREREGGMGGGGDWEGEVEKGKIHVAMV